MVWTSPTAKTFDTFSLLHSSYSSTYAARSFSFDISSLMICDSTPLILLRTVVALLRSFYGLLVRHLYRRLPRTYLDHDSMGISLLYMIVMCSCLYYRPIFPKSKAHFSIIVSLEYSRAAISRANILSARIFSSLDFANSAIFSASFS